MWCQRELCGGGGGSPFRLVEFEFQSSHILACIVPRRLVKQLAHWLEGGNAEIGQEVRLAVEGSTCDHEPKVVIRLPSIRTL